MPTRPIATNGRSTTDNTHCVGTTMFAAVSSIVIPKLSLRQSYSSPHEQHAHLKISASFPYRPCSTSAARYILSPSRSNAPAPVGFSSKRGGRGHIDAIPKSPIRNRPDAVMKMFAGFKSRCIAPAE